MQKSRAIHAFFIVEKIKLPSLPKTKSVGRKAMLGSEVGSLGVFILKGGKHEPKAGDHQTYAQRTSLLGMLRKNPKRRTSNRFNRGGKQ